MNRSHRHRREVVNLLELRIGYRPITPAWVRHAWLAMLPLLFLPNLGYDIWTPFGMVELADLLMPVYLGLVWIGSAGRRVRLLGQEPVTALAVFVGWALFGVLLFPLGSGYQGDTELAFSVLKVAKFLLYATAGLLTAAAWTPRLAAAFRWSAMCAGLVAALAILLLPNEVERAYEQGEAILGFKAANSTSVLLGMIFVYLVAGRPSPGWFAGLAWNAGLGVVLTGWLCSHGRGGWIAGALGFAYLALFGRRVVRLVLVVGALALAVYNFSPAFQEDVARTFIEGSGYGRRIGLVDDGNRMAIWASEGAKFWDAPLLGQGFFHRSGSSNLNHWGSHNFWLQMLLETGLLGGAMLVGWLVQLWRAGGRAVPRPERLGGRAGLIAGFVGALGGEYFYGGVTLFALFLVLAPTLGWAMSVERARVPVRAVGVAG